MKYFFPCRRQMSKILSDSGCRVRYTARFCREHVCCQLWKWKILSVLQICNARSVLVKYLLAWTKFLELINASERKYSSRMKKSRRINSIQKYVRVMALYLSAKLQYRHIRMHVQYVFRLKYIILTSSNYPIKQTNNRIHISSGN